MQKKKKENHLWKMYEFLIVFATIFIIDKKYLKSSNYIDKFSDLKKTFFDTSILIFFFLLDIFLH